MNKIYFPLKTQYLSISVRIISPAFIFNNSSIIIQATSLGSRALMSFEVPPSKLIQLRSSWHSPKRTEAETGRVPRPLARNLLFCDSVSMSVFITPGMNDKYPNGTPFRDLRTVATELNRTNWVQRLLNDTLTNRPAIPSLSLDSLKAHWRNISRLLFPAHCSDQFAVENPASPSRYLTLGFRGRRLQ